MSTASGTQQRCAGMAGKNVESKPTIRPAGPSARQCTCTAEHSPAFALIEFRIRLSFLAPHPVLRPGLSQHCGFACPVAGLVLHPACAPARPALPCAAAGAPQRGRGRPRRVPRSAARGAAGGAGGGRAGSGCRGGGGGGARDGRPGCLAATYSSTGGGALAAALYVQASFAQQSATARGRVHAKYGPSILWHAFEIASRDGARCCIWCH